MFKKAIIIGTSTIAQKCIDSICEHGIPVEAIEYQHSHISPLSKICERKGVPFKRLDKDGVTEYLGSLDVSCLIISAFSTYLFPKEIIEKENLVIVNYHNAFLPSHPGRNAEAWAIFSLDSSTGVTWHYVDASIDAGNILAQRTIELPQTITSLKLLDQQHKLAAKLFKEILPLIIAGGKGEPQHPAEPHTLHLSRDIPANGYISLCWNAKKIHAFLRAMDYGPLNVLGAPKICIDGQDYIWKKYKCSYHDSNPMHPYAVFDDSEIIIHTDGGDIILSNSSPVNY